MGGLQNFIIQEDLKLEHAERFILYQQQFHHQVFIDLKHLLEKRWAKEISTLVRSHKISDDDVELALLQNPKSTIKLDLTDKSEKIVTSRHRDPIESSISVKVPLLYSRDVRDLVIKKLMAASEEVFKELTQNWSEIFKVEKQGRAVPWFKIITDHDEVRLQLALSTGLKEMYKTLYSVRIDYGKRSKLKDFDRVYLISLI
jgi:hypothetical protein